MSGRPFIQIMRVLFTAQDSQTIREAFAGAKPNSEYASLYAAAVARRQADQIYNLSLTRTATVILGRGARGVIGVGRVKTGDPSRDHRGAEEAGFSGCAGKKHRPHRDGPIAVRGSQTGRSGIGRPGCNGATRMPA